MIMRNFYMMIFNLKMKNLANLITQNFNKFNKIKRKFKINKMTR